MPHADLNTVPERGPRRPYETGPSVREGGAPKSLLARLEAWASRLSIRNNFWHKVFSLVWLPFAFRSGIRMTARRTGSAAGKAKDLFAAVLPFRRFNRNFYDAMAGAATTRSSARR